MNPGFRWPALSDLRAGAAAVRAQGEHYAEWARQRIAAVDPTINAFVPNTVVARRDGDRPNPDGPLDGVPLAVKDNIAVAGLPLTCASRSLFGHVTPFDATVVARLRAAGAVVVGKTNLDEFGMGSSTETSPFGTTRNPWNVAHVAGGSSGGSAAAVAAGLVPVALGTDTGGSVRQPAAFCGIVGFKPSYGAISRFGLVAYGSSLDQAGFLGTRVDDVKELYLTTRGPDGRDHSACPPAPWAPPPQLRVGVATRYLDDPYLTLASRDAMRAAIDTLRANGIVTVDVDVPFLDDRVIAAYYVTACAEASSNLARYDGIRYGRRDVERAASVEALVTGTRQLLGEEVTLRLLLGTFVLRAGHYDRYYGRAQQVRAAVAAGFRRIFDGVDALLMPTTTGTAFEIGAFADDPLKMKLEDLFTVPANLAGLPAVALPIGLHDGLPTSVQLLSARFADEAVLAVANVLERAVGFDPSRCPAAAMGPSFGESRG
jgi:aspartyl-tRNA(Asn)/glutamyl-tRNA(Gln) amidotransferase subunit A